MSDFPVIVHRSYDPIMIDQLGDLLRDNGIAARVLGTRNAALMGAGPTIMELRIEVPHSQAAQATEFLEAFFQQDGEQLLEEEGLFDETDPSDEEVAADADVVSADEYRRPLLAAGCVLLGFGMGHFYAKRRWTTLVMAGGYLWAISCLMAWRYALAGGIMLFGLMVCDAIGAAMAAKAYNRGVRRGPLFQIFVGAIIVVGVYGFSLGAAEVIKANQSDEYGEIHYDETLHEELSEPQ